MPYDDMLFSARDQHNELARDVDSVNEQHIEDLPCREWQWPELPEPLRSALEGRLGACLIMKGRFAHEPLQERLEFLGCIVDPVRHARAA